MSDVDDDLEVAITDEWRREVKAARERKKLTQGQLGQMVDADQETISLIESETSERRLRKSGSVIRISRALGIPPPMHHLDEWQRYWSRLGYLLAEHRPENFTTVLGVIEQFVGQIPLDTETDAPAPTRPKSAMKPRAKASIAARIPGDRPLRAADELPSEAAERRKKRR